MMIDTGCATMDSDEEADRNGFEAAFNGADEMDNEYEPGSSQFTCWLRGYHAFFDIQEDQRKSNAKPAHADPVLERLEGMSAAAVADFIGWPLETWPGNCFAVASKLVSVLEWDGASAVYGHFNGAISPQCTLFKDRPVIHHGWALTRQGCIVDPTRWVFDAAEPAITILKPWEASPQALGVYDEGGEQIAAALRRPPPAFDEGERVFSLSESGAPDSLRQVAAFWLRLPPDEAFALDRLSMGQLHWLATAPYTWLGDSAALLYRWLDQVGLRGLVPVDFWTRAQREGLLER